MKKFAILSIAIALFVSGVLAQSPEPTKDHEWLEQLVGEWDAQFKMYVQPDQPPAETAGADSVRALGDHWVVAETKTTMMGAPYSGILSLGYDPQKKGFNGTWIPALRPSMSPPGRRGWISSFRRPTATVVPDTLLH